MKTVRFWFAVLVCAVSAIPSPAQSSSDKKKSPEDVAADEFFKMRGDKDAKLDVARFQKLIGLGMGFLDQYPTHKRAGDVINGLAAFGSTMREKTQAPLRAVWLSQLEYEVVNQRTKPGLSDEARAAVAALDAAVAGIRVRELPNKENLELYREKIDTLTALPGSDRFLDGQERGYAEVMTYIKPAAGEAHLRKLLEHPDQKVVAMAQEELKLVEVRKQPFELKFTALDGREVDVAQLRGKIVLLWFWSAKKKDADREHAGLKVVRDSYAKRGFEIVGIACDKEADRETMMKFLKENKIPWPQHFDGMDVKGEVASKLNVRNLPTAFLFDQKGMLIGGKDIHMDMIDPTLKKLLASK